MPRPKGSKNKPKSTNGDSELTKGQLRKLNALRKSLGDELANDVFAKWLKTQQIGGGNHPAFQQVEEALAPLIEAGELKLPRSGVLVRSWGSRLIVKAAPAEE
jgi:hypothetical protein